MSRQAKGRKWSAKVTKDFEGDSPRKIAASLKRSAERSHRRKGTPFQSAMSMLTFYLNRAGRNLPAGRKRTLEKAKNELREQFGRHPLDADRRRPS
jgi:hypothetical protein